MGNLRDFNLELSMEERERAHTTQLQRAERESLAKIFGRTTKGSLQRISASV